MYFKKEEMLENYVQVVIKHGSYFLDVMSLDTCMVCVDDDHNDDDGNDVENDCNADSSDEKQGNCHVKLLLYAYSYNGSSAGTRFWKSTQLQL